MASTSSRIARRVLSQRPTTQNSASSVASSLRPRFSHSNTGRSSQTSALPAWSKSTPFLVASALLLSWGLTPYVQSLFDHVKASNTASALEKPADAYPPPFASPEEFAKAIEEIKLLYKDIPDGEELVSLDEEDREAHGFSAWSYHEARLPSAVVWALSTEQISEIVKIASKYRVPITPFSGGTALEGHFGAPYAGISLDVSKMDKILKINEKDGDVIVQPGVGWQTLNAHLKKEGIPLFFPLDPGPGATVGGMLSTGCSGTNAVRYGTAKGEWFLNATIVLPSGEIIKTRQRARKSAAGWDTTKLFVGAEGTLGIVTELTLRLAPLLPTKCAVVNFPSVYDAVSASTEIINKGIPVQCVEFLDSLLINAINTAGICQKKYAEKDTLFFKFQGSEGTMKEASATVAEIVKKHSGKDFEFSETDEEAEALWEGRKTALWSAMALAPEKKCWTTDVCVPISALPELVAETQKDLKERGLQACNLGHVGDGNFHSLILFNPEDVDKASDAVHAMVDRAIALDGTCTGEHGVGLGKREFLPKELSQGTVDLMWGIKKHLDPKGIMNPGKLYPDPNSSHDHATGTAPARELHKHSSCC